MMNSPRSDVEKINLIEEGKKLGINELIKRSEIINNSLKSYCLKCRNDTENINSIVSNTSNGRTMISSNCAKCGSKKLRNKRAIK